MPKSPMTPEEQDAYNVLFHQIHAPVFFEKLAERGYEPQSDAEVNAMLESGAALMQAKLAERQKQASQQPSIVLQAHGHLKQALADRGLAPPPSADFDQAIKQAAHRVAQDPNIQLAAIHYQNYYARQQS